MVVTFESDQAFIAERLGWGMETDPAWWEQAGFAVVDDEVPAAASAAQFLLEAGRASPELATRLQQVTAHWRAHPAQFDATLGQIIRRIDPATALAGWVQDEAGRPMPVPPHHWWWRLSKDW